MQNLKDNQESWEKDFFEKFPCFIIKEVAYGRNTKMYSNVQSFIKFLLTTEKEKWLRDMQDGKICLNCGGKKEGKLTDSCDKCLENC